VLYSRRACHLCDEARSAVLAEHGRFGFDFEERFVDGDDHLEHEYGLRVPVVAVDGEEEFELTVDRERLRQLLGS
jgi:hypothetical protein